MYDGGNLFDPCFASPADDHRLLCPSEPLTDHRALLLRSAHPGPRNPPHADDPGPWDLELADGVTCRAVSGATTTLGDLRTTYYCSDRRWLWGDPDLSGSQWTIRSSIDLQPVHFDVVPVEATWS
jgi:hypothetical protein